MTLSCANTEGLTFIGKDPMAGKLIRRMANIQEKLCDIQNRTNIAVFSIRQYCDVELEEASSSSSSSSSDCFPICQPEILEELILISNTVALDEDVLTLITQLEQETCEVYRKIKTLEEDSGINCVPLSSSSSEGIPSDSSSSSDSSSESSSDSSSDSSSSESSSDSSSSSQDCCKEVITLSSDCPELDMEAGVPLFGMASAIPGGGPCEYRETLPSSDSSSESSSDSSSDSSSASGSSFPTGFSMRFDIATQTWKIYNGNVLIVDLPEMSACSPYGSYLIEGEGPCAGHFIIVE